MDPNAKLRPQTVLQQMLEEINFQRTKEMRQMLKDGKLYLQHNVYFATPFTKYCVTPFRLQTVASSFCRAPHIGRISLFGIFSFNRRPMPTTQKLMIFCSLCERNTSRARHAISPNTMYVK